MTVTTDVPDSLVVDFDVYDETHAMSADTFQERAAELCFARGPVVYSTAHGGYWIVTRYKEIHKVLRNPEVFGCFSCS